MDLKYLVRISTASLIHARLTKYAIKTIYTISNIVALLEMLRSNFVFVFKKNVQELRRLVGMPKGNPTISEFVCLIK